MLTDYLPDLLRGLVVTLSVAGASLGVATVLGLAGAGMKLSASPLAWRVATTYTTLVRGVPDLVLMLLVYYGGQALLNRALALLGAADVDLSPFAAGVATLGFIFGAYLTETFRGALIAVPRGQSEAGLAFGMSRATVFLVLVLPQMVRHALPGFTNNWLVLVKSTALVSLIGLSDMLHRAGLAAGATGEPFTYFLAAAALYLAVTSVSLAGLFLLARRVALPRAGSAR